MIKCEFINRMIAIPQCIWNNFTGDDDFCRWVVYDTEQKIEEGPGRRKIFEESYGYKKLCFFNYDRANQLSLEPIASSLTDAEWEAILAVAREQKFIDYTDEEKQNIRLEFANHRQNTSLMCYEDCPHDEKLAILGRLVHLTPHPKDENGQYIPIIKNSHGELVEWPKDENGNRVPVTELEKI